MSIKSFLKSDGYLNGIIIALIIPCVSVLVFIPIGRLIIDRERGNLETTDIRLYADGPLMQ